MGYGTAHDFAAMAEGGDTSRETAVYAHMRSNLYPPVSRDFLPAAMEALECADAQDWLTEIDLPNGRTVTAAQAVAQLRLDAFVQDADTDDFEDVDVELDEEEDVD
jgi:hypothetical protein